MDVPEAQDLIVGVCPEGHLHISLLDGEGKAFARFTLPADDAEMVALSIIKGVDDFRHAVGDHIGTCAGQA